MSNVTTLETTAVVEREPLALKASNALVVMEALQTVRQFVAKELKNGLDYGVVPGAGDKKVMLLPGAQKVNMLYNCYPQYKVETTELGNGHVEYRVHTQLINRATEAAIGAGVGSCSTMEAKYRWRQASRRCPACGKEAIIKGKAEFGGGWICFKKKDGCGAKFAENDAAITNQQSGRVENPDIYDQRNTVLKMAKKRSLVDASIGLGCLTELFTQDLEEAGEQETHSEPPSETATQTQAPTADREFVSTMQKWDAKLHTDGLIKERGRFVEHLEAQGQRGPYKGLRLEDWPRNQQRAEFCTQVYREFRKARNSEEPDPTPAPSAASANARGTATATKTSSGTQTDQATDGDDEPIGPEGAADLAARCAEAGRTAELR